MLGSVTVYYQGEPIVLHASVAEDLGLEPGYVIHTEAEMEMVLDAEWDALSQHILEVN